MAQYNISFAGAGRVAGALCRELHYSGMTIREVVSETSQDGKALATKCNAIWSSDLIFHEPVDIIIVAVPDHRLKEVLGKIRCPLNTPVAHTAGSFGLEAFPAETKNKGVFYPLQTFSKERKISFRELPFFIEASDAKMSSLLENMVEILGGKVYFADAGNRKMLHLAAVFTCNFLNHMLTIGKEIALKAGFPFDVLKPLIQETVSKALLNGPEVSQTGPAIRNDENTMAKHMDLLSFSPEFQKIYDDVTQSIINYYKNNL